MQSDLHAAALDGKDAGVHVHIDGREDGEDGEDGQVGELRGWRAAPTPPLFLLIQARPSLFMKAQGQDPLLVQSENHMKRKQC